MVTNYPQQLTSVGREASVGHETTGTAFVLRTAARLGQLLCAIGGHDAMLHFEGKRLMMRCTSCGYDTPGWEISDRAPRRRFEGDARRHILRPPAPKLTLRKTA